MSATAHSQLAPVLRALKLTGMLDTLDARLAEARAGTLGHVEFLQVLCEDEVARREAAAVARRLRAAHLPTTATLESFDFSFNPKLPVAQIRDLARLEFIAAGESVCIYGPVGVGKTHVATALAHQACRRGHDANFVTCSRLLAELAGGHADNSFGARLRRLAKPAVLCERLGRPGRSLVLSSNRSPADWYPLFPNAVVGESILDRLINSSHLLLMDGKSYRPNCRPGQTRPGKDKA